MKACKKLGIEEVPCIVADDLTEDQIKAFRIADNKVGEVSTWNMEKLGFELADIDIDMSEFGDFGFEDDSDNVDLENKEQKPELEFTEVLGEEHNYVVLYFDNDIDWLQAESLLDIKPRKNLSTRTDGKITESMTRVSVGRVLNGAEALERLRIKEDYDMTLQNCNKYRGCLRVNSYFYDCKQSKQAGGCATYRNYQRETEQLELLQKKWGKSIVKIDNVVNQNAKRAKKNIDYNPIIRIPIKGV